MKDANKNKIATETDEKDTPCSRPSAAGIVDVEPAWMADICSSAHRFAAPRQLLLGNCSCVALISYIHVAMRCPTTVHPWTYALSYYRSSMDICNICISYIPVGLFTACLEQGVSFLSILYIIRSSDNVFQAWNCFLYWCVVTPHIHWKARVKFVWCC